MLKGWFVEHFIEHAVGAHPLLLHSPRYQPELNYFAKQYGIVQFCLPPHTTHVSQPLDASVFRSLKQNWQALYAISPNNDHHQVPVF